MSRRYSIVDSLVNKLKLIDGTGIYKSNLFGNAYPELKFWDEVSDFPYVCAVPGTEYREYKLSDFTWSFFGVPIKVYCKGENAQRELETLIEDIDKCIRANETIIYDETNLLNTTEIMIERIVTDEGLLAPYAVGEITAKVRYQLLFT